MGSVPTDSQLFQFLKIEIEIFEILEKIVII